MSYKDECTKIRYSWAIITCSWYCRYSDFVAGVNVIGTGLYCCGGTLVVVKTYNGKFHSEL